MRFEKVSMDAFLKAFRKEKPEMPRIKAMEFYTSIKIPKQGSRKSMGMDFFAPYDITIPPLSAVLIPTGIRWITDEEDENKGLLIVPRSGIGFKTGTRLVNTIGVIDADYYMSDNEGHIMVKLYNPQKDDPVEIKQGTGMVQGIITEYFVCEGSESEEKRNGGFGSTSK